MKKQLAVLFLALTTATTATSAMAHDDDAYNLEIEYNSHNVQHQGTNWAGDVFNRRNNTTNWLFTYYFDEISTSRGPRAEAAFLNRASSLSLPTNGNETSLGFEYFGEDYDFYVRLQNEENVHDQIHLGWMIDTNWLVAAHGEYDDFNGGKYGLYTKKVFSLDNGGFFNVKVGFDKSRFADSYGLETEQYYAELDYYVDQDLSYGITIADNKDDFNGDNYSVEYRTQWFATDQLSLGLSYTNGVIDRSNSLVVDDVLSAKVKFRF